MMQKMTPLLVLALFGGAVYLMKKGMDNAVNLSHPKKVITK